MHSKDSGRIELIANQVEFAYKKWLSCMTGTDRAELLALDESGKADSFFRNLEFGTGGLRGKLGLGPNRLNVYTVGKSTQGLADYLNNTFENPTVALCRDTRHGSEEFVRRVAEVLAGNGIKSYLFDRVEPTPALSFAVRELGCSAGVNITASHNPAAYNGYKVYGADGCQITVEAAEAIQAAIDPVDCFDGVRAMPFDSALEKGFVQWIPEKVLDRYLDETLKVSTGEDCSGLRIVYTPLHGVGLECVSRVLEGVGVAEAVTVEEQCVHDGDFPTCPYPNPEVREALKLGLEYCDRVKPDLLLATDPDTDRVGIAVPHAGAYLCGMVRKLLEGYCGCGPAFDEQREDLVRLFSLVPGVDVSSLERALDSVEVYQKYNNALHKRDSGKLLYSPADVPEVFSDLCYGSLDYSSLASDKPALLEFIARYRFIEAVRSHTITREHIAPLIQRYSAELREASKLYEPCISGFKSDVSIISLLNVNLEQKKIVPLVVAKTLYQFQKGRGQNERGSSAHLVVDEAHNILSYSSQRESENWRDYRLETFEEIGKAVSFIDGANASMIPVLPQGCCIVSGTATTYPVRVQVDALELEKQPMSFDRDLAKAWGVG